MKIRDGFVLRRMPGMALVMAADRHAGSFSGALKLNETGAFIFEHLQQGFSAEQTARALAEVYDVTEEQAAADVRETVSVFRANGIAEA